LRKRFTQETCSEKFGAIVSSFPVLTDQHPFHRDLMNILYDADHFKVALGQVSTAKHLIETISRDYVRLLKVCPRLPGPRGESQPNSIATVFAKFVPVQAAQESRSWS